MFLRIQKNINIGNTISILYDEEKISMQQRSDQM